jgi:hypothetical protein
MASGKIESRIFHDEDAIRNPRNRGGPEEIADMMALDDTGLIFRSDKPQARPLILPKGARIIETTIADIRQQNVSQIPHVLFRFTRIRELQTPSTRQLCNGQPFLFAKQDRHGVDAPPFIWRIENQPVTYGANDRHCSIISANNSLFLMRVADIFP